MSVGTGPFALTGPELAKHGFRVLPVRPQSKKPWQQAWPDRATCDLAVLAVSASRYPGANVGIAAGQGLLVVDLDVKASTDGRASLLTLERLHGDLPATVTAITPTGGRHLYFLAPLDCSVRNSVGKVGRGIDVRSAGGYVVAPPSYHPDGGQYIWAPGLSPADILAAPLPDAWLRTLQGAADAPAATADRAPPVWQASAYGAASLAREAAQVAATLPGGRNSRLSLAALRMGQLADAGHLGPGQAQAVLVGAGVQAGLERGEALATVASGFRASPQFPRASVPLPSAASVPALPVASLDALAPSWQPGSRLAQGPDGHVVLDRRARPVPGLDVPVAALDPILVDSINQGLHYLGGVVGFRVLHYLVLTAHSQMRDGICDFHHIEVIGAFAGLAAMIGQGADPTEVRAVVLALAHLRFRFANGTAGNLLTYQEPVAAAPGQRALLCIDVGAPLLPGYAASLPDSVQGRRHRMNRWLVPLLPSLPRLDALPWRLQAAGLRLHWLILRELTARPRELQEHGGIPLDRAAWSHLAGDAGLDLRHLDPLLCSWCTTDDVAAAFLAEIQPGLWTLGPDHLELVDFIVARLAKSSAHRQRAGYYLR